MTRADRHRLLDMQEAVNDLSVIVARGRSAWNDVRGRDLARVRDVYTHAYHRVDFELMWQQLATQLPSLRETLGRIGPDGIPEE